MVLVGVCTRRLVWFRLLIHYESLTVDIYLHPVDVLINLEINFSCIKFANHCTASVINNPSELS